MPLHPQAKAFLDALAARKAPGWEEMTPEEGRALFSSLKELFGKGPSVHRVQNTAMADRVPVRVYRPSAAKKLPALMYFHGGGWVLGDLDTHDALCSRLAHESSCVVVSVDYRRAPEHKYPAALDDCWRATNYFAEHCQQLGIDASRLAVAGDSAGGNLAAAVALKARDQGRPAVLAQLLIYPALEPRFDSRSYVEYSEGYGLSRAAMIWFWQQYLGRQEDGTDPYAAPARAASLNGLPPAHFVIAEFDVLRSEGEAYAARLAECGVPTTSRHYDGMIHGFVHFSGIFDVGNQAVSDVAQILRTTFRVSDSDII